MVSNAVTLIDWWTGLSAEWQHLLKNQIELEEGISFSPANIHLLKELDFSGAKISDLNPITYLTNLESLDISETQVYDLRPLLKLPYLKELHITFSPSLDLRLIGRLNKLEILDISYPQLKDTDIASLSGLTNLKELYCNACNIDTVIHFMTLQNLEVLCAYFNHIPTQEMMAFKELMPSCRILS